MNRDLLKITLARTVIVLGIIGICSLAGGAILASIYEYGLSAVLDASLITVWIVVMFGCLMAFIWALIEMEDYRRRKEEKENE